jgi:hypothetical protein
MDFLKECPRLVEGVSLTPEEQKEEKNLQFNKGVY